MKALRINEFGGPGVLRYQEIPTPVPGPGQVLVKVAGSGLNWAEQLQREGRYAGPPPPLTMGLEGSGTVEALGPGVTELKVGDRVLGRGNGWQAEYIAIDAGVLFHCPPGLDLVHAGGVPIIFPTAYFMLRTRANVEKGETVLVHAGASGVGTIAIQLAKLWGARVLATASTEEKLKLAASLGADVTINYVTQDFEEEVKAATEGVGADVILDAVGGEVFEKSVKCLAPYGRLVVYGTSSGVEGTVNHRELYTTNKTVIGFSMSRTPPETLDIRGGMKELLSLLDAGTLRLVVDRIIPMSGIIEAHQHLASRGSRGKTILVPD